MSEPRLLLGPMLRYVDLSDATVWVETDSPCLVTVQVGEPADRRSVTEPTWSVHGHHYALIRLSDLPVGSVLPYTVRLDDMTVWPEPTSSYPPSVIRTLGGAGSLRIAFGSCRRVAGFDRHGLRALGADALVGLAERMRTCEYDLWPDALFMAGDQIYADEPSEALTTRLRAMHRNAPGGRQEVHGEVWNFEEYTCLYHESWSPEPVRWLLSTVPTCMLLDDHDLRDDWNTSIAWRHRVTATDWWRDRVIGAFSSYWIYQHVGNLSPHDLDTDTIFAMVRAEGDEARRSAALDEFAWRADAEVGSARWSFVRDFGDDQTAIRLVAIDCRASRHLQPQHRVMVDDREWGWISDQASARPDGRPITHLLIGATLPVLLPRGIHYLEGWNEELASGRYGQRAERFAEWLRQVVDLEHWSAFRTSFERVVDLLRRLVSVPTPPATILFLSGDVHCSYAAPAQLSDTAHPGTVIQQLTMSPFRNYLPRPLRWVNKLVERRGLLGALRRLARAVDLPDTGLDWELAEGPWFTNGLMTVVLHDRNAWLEVDQAHHRRGRQFLRRLQTIWLTPA